jgi:hypothetical protein
MKNLGSGRRRLFPKLRFGLTKALKKSLIVCHRLRKIPMIESVIAIAAAISASVAIILLVRAAAALSLAESAARRAMALDSEAAALADRAKTLASLASAKVFDCGID